PGTSARATRPRRSPGSRPTRAASRASSGRERDGVYFAAMELAGTAAVVTGATEGIGRAIAFALGRAGARVAICARTAARVDATVRELAAAGVEAAGTACDVSDPAAVEAFAGFVHRRFGAPRIVVNNAGIGRFRPLEELSLAGKNGVEGGTAYCASKHAVLGFSKALMLEVRKHNVRVVAVCPGSVDTAFAGRDARPRPNRDRVLAPDDVAHAVLAALTASDRAMLSELDIRPTNP